MDVIEISRQCVRDAFDHPDAWETHLAAAATLLATASEQRPADPLLLTCLGAVLCDQGHHAQARVRLEQAIVHGSRDRNTYFNLGVALLNSGEPEAARARFEQARSLQASAQSWEAYFDPQAH